MTRSLLVVAALAAACQTPEAADPADAATAGVAAAPRAAATARIDKGTLQLGNFSVSLAVADLAKSRAFYEALGFEAVGGDPAQNWLILQNAGSTIGLFQGMFERNLLTFNPGWNQSAEKLIRFTDVREIQQHLEQRGLTLVSKADPASKGPASLMVIDPDGNPVLIDQHVPAPEPSSRTQ